MATIFGRKSKPAKRVEATPDPVIHELQAEQDAIDVLRAKIAELRPQVKDLEQERDGIDVQVSDILAAKLMGQPVAPDHLAELYTRKERNQADLSDLQLTLLGLESRLTAVLDQENARLAALLKPQIRNVGEEIEALELQYAEQVAALGDTIEALIDKHGEFQQLSIQHSRISPK